MRRVSDEQAHGVLKHIKPGGMGDALRGLALDRADDLAAMREARSALAVVADRAHISNDDTWFIRAMELLAARLDEEESDG